LLKENDQGLTRPFPTVKLSSGSLAVFAPLALTPLVFKKLEALGNKVAYIAAPDLGHYAFLSEWIAA
jgi:hypothetical protein